MVTRRGRDPALHPLYSASMLARAAEAVLAELAVEVPAEETLAHIAHELPEGPGWRAWPHLLPRALARMEVARGRPGCHRHECFEAAWRMACEGRLDLVVTPHGGRRGRTRFLRLHVDGAPGPTGITFVPRRAGFRGGKVVYAAGRMALGKRVLLDVLAAPASLSEVLSATTREPPEGGWAAGWRPWPLVHRRFEAVLRPVIVARLHRLASESAWELADEGRVEVGFTPMRGHRLGRLRFARLAPAAANATPEVVDSALASGVA